MLLKKMTDSFCGCNHSNNVSKLKARILYKLTCSTQLIVIDEIMLYLIFEFNSEFKTAKVT